MPSYTYDENGAIDHTQSDNITVPQATSSITYLLQNASGSAIDVVLTVGAGNFTSGSVINASGQSITLAAGDNAPFTMDADETVRIPFVKGTGGTFAWRVDSVRAARGLFPKPGSSHVNPITPTVYVAEV